MDSTQITTIINATDFPAVIKEPLSIWFWVALAEFIFIILSLVLRIKKRSSDFIGVKKSDLRNTGDNADMKNLVNSIAKSRELYKELSRQCHPDRFVNTDLQSIAEDIFQEVSRNKRDYKRLLALKESAIEKLNIKF
jgi:DNA-binding transcriptional regulator GbsR (MarR family)